MYTHTYIEISLYINRIRTAVRGDFTIWSHTQTTYAYHIAVALVLLDRKAQREHPLLLAATYPSISLYIYLQPPQCAPPSRLLDEQEQQFKLACSHPKVVNSILSSNHPQKKKRYLWVIRLDSRYSNFERNGAIDTLFHVLPLLKFSISVSFLLSIHI